MYHYSYQSLDGLYSLICEGDSSKRLLQARYFPFDETGALNEKDFSTLKKGHSEYLKMSICGAPARSIWAQMTVEGAASSNVQQLAKNYIKKMFNVSAEDYELALLHPQEGTLLPMKSTQIEREFVIAGAHKQSFLEWQNQWIALKIYPQRLELNPVVQAGAVSLFTSNQGIDTPTIVVDIEKNNIWITVLRKGRVEYTRTIARGVRAWLLELELEQEGADESSLWKGFYQGTLQGEVAAHSWVQRLTKDIRDSVGMYEVQSGRAVDHIWISPLGEQLSWLRDSLIQATQIKPLEPDFKKWFNNQGIEVASEANLSQMSSAWLGACGLMNLSSKTGGKHA